MEQLSSVVTNYETLASDFKIWMNSYKTATKVHTAVHCKLLKHAKTNDKMINITEKFEIGNFFRVSKKGKKLEDNTAGQRARVFHRFMAERYSENLGQTIFGRTEISDKYKIDQEDDAPLEFSCPVKHCSESFDCEEELEIHRLRKHANTTHKCRLCEKEMKHPTQHLNKYHKEEYMEAKKNKTTASLYTSLYKLTCKFCDKAIDTIQTLVKHIHEMHIDPDEPCEKCGKILKPSAVYFHMKSVHNIEVYKWSCDVCNVSFKHKHTYRNHLQCDDHLKNVKRNSEEYRQEVKRLLYEKLGVKLDLDSGGTKVTCQRCHKSFMKQGADRHEKTCIQQIALSQYPGGSQGERIVFKYLTLNNIKFETQWKRPDLLSSKGRAMPYDFYLPDDNIIIEYHGIQHYVMTNYSDAEEIFKRNLRNDKAKVKYAHDNNIELIVIDCRVYTDEDKIFNYLDSQLYE